MSTLEDDSFIKKAGTKVTFTKEQMDELKNCMNPVKGPEYFMEEFVWIQHPIKGKIKFDLYDYQRELIDCYHNNRYSIALISRQMGKALSLDTPLITPTGFTTVGEVKVGDVIYGRDGKTTNITYITETMDDRTCYELSFSNGEKITADAEHLWTVEYSGSNGEVTITTEKLRKILKKTNDLYINHTEPLQFEETEVIVEPYYLGTQICSTSGGTDIPDNYIFNSMEIRLALIQGLMDSHGISDKNGTSKFEHVSSGTIDKVELLLSTLGIKSKRTVREETIELYFCTDNIPLFRFPSKLYNQMEAKCGPASNRIYVDSIVKVKSVPVICLQVDNADHMFLCGKKLTPTHNTTVAAAYLLWYSMFVPDSMILIASKTGDDAIDIMGKVRFAYESLPDHIRAGVREYNKKSMVFDNGSKIVSKTTTASTGRGMAISLIYLDEFAFIDPPKIAQELWTSLSPTLATGGKCLITSTPNSETDTFAQIWFSALDNLDEYGNERIDGTGKNGFKPYFATYEAHPDRDKEWAVSEEGKIGEARFAREHKCEFIVFDETLINSIALSKIKPKDPLRTTGQVRWFRNIMQDHTYVVVLDPCMGTGGDNAAIQVWELPAMKQVAEWYHNNTPIEGQMRVFKQILTEIYDKGEPEIYWSLETNNIGEAALVVIRDTGEDNFPGTFLHDSKRARGKGRRRKGYVTTNKTKLDACSRLKQWVESGTMKVYSKPYLNELANYVAKGMSFEAKTGNSDDLVSASLIFVRMAEQISSWDTDTHDMINSDINDDDYGDDPMPIIVM